jgi:hypothetical protein
LISYNLGCLILDLVRVNKVKLCSDRSCLKFLKMVSRRRLIELINLQGRKRFLEKELISDYRDWRVQTKLLVRLVKNNKKRFKLIIYLKNKV